MTAKQENFTIARWVFAWALGLIFFSAFASFAVEIRGLAGGRGIVPAGPWLDAVWNQLGAAALWQVPTFCWLGAGDAMLVCRSAWTAETPPGCECF